MMAGVARNCAARSKLHKGGPQDHPAKGAATQHNEFSLLRTFTETNNLFKPQNLRICSQSDFR